jgi:hypothetical protein
MSSLPSNGPSFSSNALAAGISLLFEDALEGCGIELGKHALEGRFLGVIIRAVAFAVAAQRAELKLGEPLGECRQIALAPRHSGESGHDHDGEDFR